MLVVTLFWQQALPRLRAACALAGLLFMAMTASAQTVDLPNAESNTDAVAQSPDESAVTRLQITDPYIELHTGPGEVYPVFHVEDRGQWIEILLRKTDWFKARTARGIEGWVHRKQLERTLTAVGVSTRFRDVLVDDYLQRRLEFGIAGGSFDSDPVVSARLAYWFSDNVALEGAYSQVAGKFVSSELYYLNIVSQPFPDWRFSPYFSLGVGHFHSAPKATLVNAVDVDATAVNAGIGLRVYMSRRFMLRADVKDYAAFVGDNDTHEFKEWLLGLSFFF